MSDSAGVDKVRSQQHGFLSTDGFSYLTRRSDGSGGKTGGGRRTVRGFLGQGPPPKEILRLLVVKYMVQDAQRNRRCFQYIVKLGFLVLQNP